MRGLQGSSGGTNVDLTLKAARFNLKLTPTTTEGLIGTYTRALRRDADAYPDADGKMTAISAALDVKFVQAYILHGDKKVAAKDPAAAPAQH